MKTTTIKLALVSLGSLISTAFSQATSHEWSFLIGSTNTDETKAIAIDKNGDIVVTGTFNGTIDFDPSASTVSLTSAGGSNDIYLAKYRDDKTLVWAKSIGNSLAEEVWDLKIDNQNNIIIGGLFNGTCDFDPSANNLDLISYGNTDGFVAKYNELGNIIFAKQVGGADIDRVNRVAVHPTTNEIAIAGYFKGSAHISPGAQTLLVNASNPFDIDGFVAKLSSSGVLQWGFDIGSTGNDQCVGVDFSGNDVLLTGYANQSVEMNPLGTSNAYNYGTEVGSFVNKYNGTNGILIWRNINTSSGNPLAAFDLICDKYGNTYVTGYKNGISYFNGVQTNLNLGSSDAYLLKLDASGNQVFNHIIGANGQDAGWDIGLSTSHDTVAVSGQFQGVGRFNPYDPNKTVSGNLKDGFVAYYKANGIYIDAFNIGGPGTSANDNIWACAIGNGKLYIGGNGQSTLDFDPSANTVNLGAQGTADGYLASYDITCRPAANPLITLLTNDTICVNTQSEININGVLNSDTNWALRNGSCSGSIIGYGNTFTLTDFTTPGTYNFSVNGVGCGQTDSCTSFSIVAVEKNLTINQSNDTLFAESNPNYVYQWINCSNNMVITNATDYFFTPQNPGDFAVVIEAFNCIDTSACFNYTCIPAANPTITLLSNDTICIGSQVEVNINGDLNLDTNWVLRDGSCSGNILAINNTFTISNFFNPGSYNFSVNGVGCGQTDSCSSFTIVAIEKDLNISVSGDTLFAENNPNYSYQWLDCNNSNSPINGATNNYYVVSTSGTYAVVIEAYDCIDTTTCFTHATTEIGSSTVFDNLKIYPNPATSEIELNDESGKELDNILIYDLQGKEQVFSIKKLNKNKAVLSVNHLKAGIYIIYTRTKQTRFVKSN